MPSKGITEPWCAQAVASSVSRAGFGRLSFRSDTEPAIVALKRAAGHILTTKFGTEIVPEEASMGDSTGRACSPRGERQGAKPRTWAEKVAWPRAGANSPSGYAVDSVGGDDNQYRAPRD